MRDFLPISKADMERRGWEQCDFVYVIGDAYVDHPSFGHAIISRVLEAAGYKVGFISQPDWKNPQSITVLGRPRLGFLVTGGNMDSMVNHYSVSKKHRKMDAFTPGGVIGKRPDYATVVYCNLIRRVYKDIPILIGGIEASLRRMAHYDYWSDKLKRSILLDSQADLLMYGMGERSVVEVADALDSGLKPQDITFVNGTVYRATQVDLMVPYVTLPSYQQLCEDKRKYAQSFYTQYCNTDPFSGKTLVEPYGSREYVIQNPAQKPLSQAEMDRVYGLPYMRTYHPSYEAAGGVPAIEEVRFSLVSCRGCFGGCSFCALTFHQGRIIQTRSHESILAEAQQMVWEPDFKGYIHDVGGPTANFRRPACKKQMKAGLCRGKACLAPEACPNLDADHTDYLMLLRKIRAVPGVKKVFIRSGIRFDFMQKDKSGEFFAELVKYHVSGQLKVAPEHCVNSVLDYMGKPHIEVYERFKRKYESLNQKYGKEQYLVPYLMSSHPGCTLNDAVELAQWLNRTGRQPEQVQDFYPTPGTLSTCMYYTGIDPRTMKPVYVPKDPHEKAMQRALMQWKRPEKRALVREALHRAHREDLIGFGKDCLLRPEKYGKPQESKLTSNRGRTGKGSKPAAQKGDKPQAKPTRKAGWAVAKPKKNARPRKGKG